jgi:hypothetical protein
LRSTRSGTRPTAPRSTSLSESSTYSSPNRWAWAWARSVCETNPRETMVLPRFLVSPLAIFSAWRTCPSLTLPRSRRMSPMVPRPTSIFPPVLGTSGVLLLFLSAISLPNFRVLLRERGRRALLARIDLRLEYGGVRMARPYAGWPISMGQMDDLRRPCPG